MSTHFITYMAVLSFTHLPPEMRMENDKKDWKMISIKHYV